jgi:DnaK suppressor protein
VRAADATRTADLRKTLADLKSDLLSDLHGRIREGRTDKTTEVVDQAEGSDNDVREGLDLALLEMRANTLRNIDEAIIRLDAGRYGFCFECDGPIAVRRLHALPFAVRCRSCEEEREVVPGRARPDLARRAGLLSTLVPSSSESGLS